MDELDPQRHALAPELETTITPKKKGKNRWRPPMRALHRDMGYFAVGLTFIYAVSGIAVNHIADWEPNYIEYERTHQLLIPIPEDDKSAGTLIQTQLGFDEPPQDVYRTEDELEFVFDGDTQVVVSLASGTALERGRESRPLIRVANWLHLNRGKKAWTYVADTYAVFLLFLAGSGMLMIPGKKGFKGRGWLFVAAGVALPVLYVVLSGGPGG